MQLNGLNKLIAVSEKGAPKISKLFEGRVRAKLPGFKTPPVFTTPPEDFLRYSLLKKYNKFAGNKLLGPLFKSKHPDIKLFVEEEVKNPEYLEMMASPRYVEAVDAGFRYPNGIIIVPKKLDKGLAKSMLTSEELTPELILNIVDHEMGHAAHVLLNTNEPMPDRIFEGHSYFTSNGGDELLRRFELLKNLKGKKAGEDLTEQEFIEALLEHKKLLNNDLNEMEAGIRDLSGFVKWANSKSFLIPATAVMAGAYALKQQPQVAKHGTKLIPKNISGTTLKKLIPLGGGIKDVYRKVLNTGRTNITRKIEELFPEEVKLFYGRSSKELIKDAPWGRLPMEYSRTSSTFKPTDKLIIQGGKTKVARVITDAGYLEMILKRLGISREEAKKLVQTQLDAIDFSKLGHALLEAPLNGVYAQANLKPHDRSFLKIFGTVYRDKQNNTLFMDILDTYMQPRISIHPKMLEEYPGTHWFGRGSHEVGHISTLSKENSGNEYLLLLGKNNKRAASKVRDVVFTNYAKHPWEIPVSKKSKFKGTGVIEYLTRADEMRVRALKLERIKLTTGQSYEDILSNAEYLKDPDIKLLHDLYNKAYYEDGNAVLEFLNLYAKQGGKLIKKK